MDALTTQRNRIDSIDTSIVNLLAERFKVTDEIGRYKKVHGLPPIDKAREAAHFEDISKKAQEAGLDPELAQKILRLLVDEVVKNHKKLGLAGQ